ncbi:hypothetical protein [Azospirillum rugosum]|uniref:STAS domain-containing protein n=1 Tax=Azospirillum rugosum TaxID=416170 RepID=A0ABS4SIV5_9PROT|nr:hypothetical protein [Azospirillum rugosum]MBP2291340.1 hypothetical protein [Azospirillum rugosum]MDQ0525128.1 hypothetical protein [Azospirillum rugosum]
MPIRFDGETARFDGACTADEAIPLAEWTEAANAPRVDLGACTSLHTALLQVLMVAHTTVAVEPEDAFLKAWVAPLLRNTPG